MKASPSLPELLRTAAGRHPDRLALTGPGLVLTYGQLDRCVSRLAADFAAAGLRPGDLVGLGVEHGALPMVMSAAVMRAGAAYVPLDIRHPPARLRHVCDTAGLRLAVCDGGGEAALRGLPVTTMLVDLDDVRSAAAGTAPGPGPTVTGGMTAYVMFTSGSSGVPKGVPVTHANLTALIEDALGLFGYGDDEVWPLVHGYGFDVSVWEMWAGVAVGAHLVALDGATVASPPRLAEALARYQPTRLHIVPSVFRHLADAVAADAVRISPRSVVFCGEPINYRAVRTWLDHSDGPAPDWVNVYGITETTVYNTFHVLSARQLREAAAATPVGRAYRRSPIVVLDPQLQPVGTGEQGEILIGGAQLSPGYLGNPELTEQRFVALDGRPGRWYRTGDLGFVDRDGVVHHCGRADDQVKVRGVRIELGEIDCALRQVPWLRDGAAVLTRSARGEPAITACVVPAQAADGPPTALPRLRSLLAQTMPDYMLPTAVRVLDQLPQNANGKTDRLALAAQAEEAR